MLSTTFLKTHPEDEKDGNNMLLHAFVDSFALSHYFCVMKLIISSDKYLSPHRRDSSYDEIR